MTYSQPGRATARGAVRSSSSAGDSNAVSHEKAVEVGRGKGVVGGRTGWLPTVGSNNLRGRAQSVDVVSVFLSAVTDRRADVARSLVGPGDAEHCSQVYVSQHDRALVAGSVTSTPVREPLSVQPPTDRMERT